MTDATDGFADIADECIHLLTTAFCSICKKNARIAEQRARARRRATEDAWSTEGHPAGSALDDSSQLPYPFVDASWPGRCTSCDDDYPAGTRLYRADGGWCCRSCAEDFATLGVGADG